MSWLIRSSKSPKGTGEDSPSSIGCGDEIVPFVFLARGVRSGARFSVSAGLARAGYEDSGGDAGAVARAVRESVQDAGDRGIGREDADQDNRDSCE